MYKKADGLPHIGQVYGESLANAQTLPQNTSADGNEGPIQVSGILGALEVIVRANTAITIADTKALTVKLQHRDGAAAFADLATIYSLTAASGSGSIAKGVELARFALPSNVKTDLKAVITTTDAAAAGKLDILPSYLPR
ncbi:hypothetical protein [Magnetospirillum molischianum]|uniref:Uncharacterized protein n=1 Tax=Magnetospirillum molischianum DSM 120 TaxID=1150626 RepID=H8FP68_MAGML|nr:hypothetical protein [Magnetospirillum molischianum]CCG40156.1 conserved hypothetical protein [Magnetospirillum molischianum DSM 120]